jgi:hypothetical protein
VCFLLRNILKMQPPSFSIIVGYVLQPFIGIFVAETYFTLSIL